METLLLRLLLPVLFVVGAIGLILFIIKFVQNPNRHGGSVSSGVIGVMNEIDRITRPSAEHRQQVEEQIEREDDIGGD